MYGYEKFTKFTKLEVTFEKKKKKIFFKIN